MDLDTGMNIGLPPQIGDVETSNSLTVDLTK